MLFSLPFFFFFLFAIDQVNADGKTQIYIDQAPLYSSLGSCAQDRVSAIVRAQSSGCGDDMQLTSFSCFCIDSSSVFASKISTDIVKECASGGAAAPTTRGSGGMATTTNASGSVARIKARATATAAAASAAPTGAVARDVKTALDVFASYCARSTELKQFQQPETITVGPSSQPTSEGSKHDHKNRRKSGTLIAAVVVSTVVLLLIVIGAVLFYLHRRRKLIKKQSAALAEMDAPQGYRMENRLDNEAYAFPRTELDADEQQRVEMGDEKSMTTVYAHGMQHPAVELDAAESVPRPTKTHPNEKPGWV